MFAGASLGGWSSSRRWLSLCLLLKSYHFVICRWEDFYFGHEQNNHSYYFIDYYKCLLEHHQASKPASVCRWKETTLSSSGRLTIRLCSCDHYQLWWGVVHKLRNRCSVLLFVWQGQMGEGMGIVWKHPFSINGLLQHSHRIEKHKHVKRILFLGPKEWTWNKLKIRKGGKMASRFKSIHSCARRQRKEGCSRDR